MGEHVEIRTSPSDLISTAADMRTRGEALREAMRTANAAISEIEGGPETLPADKFSEQFRGKYFETIEDSRGEPVPTNEAVRSSAEDMGDRLTELGNFVAGAMFAYSGTDDENAGDISRSGDA